MSNKFINLNQTTDVAELQARVRELEESVANWESMGDVYIAQAKNANKLLDLAQQRIEELEELVEIYESTISKYDRIMEQYGEIAQLSSRTPGSTYDSGSPRLTHGLGMSYSKDKGAKVYRVSDPDGPLIPELEFQGAELEVGRGEGIHFGMRWNKKK